MSTMSVRHSFTITFSTSSFSQATYDSNDKRSLGMLKNYDVLATSGSLTVLFYQTRWQMVAQPNGQPNWNQSKDKRYPCLILYQ